VGRYRGRFAPSPTGPLHFGSLVAAVASFLEARTRGGEWLIRMDDLDPPPVAAGAAEDILRTLAACGLEWDGPVVYQSTRSAAYHCALHHLRGRGLVYPCACSRREIADSALAGAEGPVYPGTCRGEKLSKQTRARAVDAARPLPALLAALTFLGQSPPHRLATVRGLWAWALENWKLERVPRVASAPA
jgi:glutamyl-Q tRNA(Asp) synthetase